MNVFNSNFLCSKIASTVCIMGDFQASLYFKVQSFFVRYHKGLTDKFSLVVCTMSFMLTHLPIYYLYKILAIYIAGTYLF